VSDTARVAFEAMYNGGMQDVLYAAGRETFTAMKMLKAANPAQYQPANGASYPRGPFGMALQQVVQLVWRGGEGREGKSPPGCREVVEAGAVFNILHNTPYQNVCYLRQASAEIPRNHSSSITVNHSMPLLTYCRSSRQPHKTFL